MTMQASIAIDGGIGFFPGLARPRPVSFDAMPPDVQARIKELVSAANFFTRPDACEPGGADRRTYVIEIADDAGDEKRAKTHTLRVSEPVKDPSLASLIALLRDYAK